VDEVQTVKGAASEGIMPIKRRHYRVYNCVKKPYDEGSVNREIRRLMGVGQRNGKVIEREKQFCVSCRAWHIAYPQHKGHPPTHTVKANGLQS
jgi:hypothetical protein